MKTLVLTPILALLLAGSSLLTAQNKPDGYLGLPGDNLNLFAVMNLFQESETLETFEKKLNDSNTMINNLDLNGNNLVDYIMVHDYVDGNIHNIVLRVAMNQYENQDVAVFTVEKFRDGSVQIQLIGDEALYGPNYIVEPNYAETPNPGYRGNVVQQRNVTVVRTTYYEVASWPVITYIYRPSYRVWRSSWYWGYYPTYWAPWTPHYWHYYYGYHYNWNTHYYTYYRPWRQPRCVHYHTVYHTRIRHHSPNVTVMVNNGSYRNTYSRPETRKEGEVLYSHRQSTGSTVPASNRTLNNAGGRHSSGTNSDVNTRVSRQENTDRNSAINNNSRPANNGARQNTEVGRNQSATSNTVRETRAASVQGNTPRQTPEVSRSQNTPVNNNGRSQAVKNNEAPRKEAVARPSGSENQAGRVQSAPARETRNAPAANVNRSSSDRNATPNAPARVTNREAQSGSNQAVRSQAPRTSSQPANQVKASPQSGNNRSSGTPAQRSSDSNRRSSDSGDTGGSRAQRR